MMALGTAAAEPHVHIRQVRSTEPQWRPTGAHLTLGSALHIAEAEAKRNRVHFSDFESPEFWYDCTHGKDCVWVFFYEGKVIEEGNDFMVYVNDRTKRSKYTHGY
jgi:hypothetical protein